jgi:hypothetical protein
MTTKHALRCRCGKLTGEVAHPESGTRAVCYCKDCQAFARFLGRPDQVLDPQRGTEIVAILPAHVSFTGGLEHLACMSLSPKGLLRWYARCCNTPIGNTPRDFRVAHVGLVHTCLSDPAHSLDESFGPVKMRVNTQGALGEVRASRLDTFAAIVKYLAALTGARLGGSYKRTPFFDAAGVPVRTPSVLSKAEHERLREAA